MKILLTFFTIVLFSFGANSKLKTNNFNFKIECNELKELIKFSMFNHNFYNKEFLKTDNIKAQNFSIERSNKELDKAFKYSTIYNTFCKK